ncbi:MAG: hypothetical protein HKN13_12795 [Rhodothermales bacterium]|nr:hypothetical protein [Rhodothermales bacterium]
MSTPQRTARTISYVLNPLVLPPVLFAGVVWLAGAEPSSVLIAAGITLVFFAVVPLVPMIIAVRARPGTTLELRDRLQRTVPYAVGIGSYLVCIPILKAAELPAQQVLVGMMVCFILNGALLMVINLFWKISLHVSTLAGCFSILAYVVAALISPEYVRVDLPIGAVLLAAALFTGTLMWARVKDEAHTVSQVLAGAAFGAILPLVVLSTLDYLGLFDTF